VQLRFGGYCLDAATRQLLHGTSEIPLSPKAVDLLQFLIANRPRALSKAELHNHLWPATFVTDAALTVLVAELRDALRDRAATPSFIRTVRRFGYAFCGEISGAVDAPMARRTCWIVCADQEIALHEGENIIGRDPGVTVQLDLPSVSRRHARIVVSSNDATVEDLGSKNGTFLRNNRIAGAVHLADLDELQVGSARLVVRILRGDVETQTLGDH
jgi:DNA-binding winged helix-turn-helix (wHTH) protein